MFAISDDRFFSLSIGNICNSESKFQTRRLRLIRVSPTGNPPRVCLVAAFPPGATHGGGAILRDLLRAYPRSNLKWISTTKPDLAGALDFDVAFAPLGFRGLRFFPTRLGRGCAHLAFCRAARSRVSRIIGETNSDIVWFVLDDFLLPLVHSLLPDLRLPFHCSIHDDPLLAAPIHNWTIPGAPRMYLEIMRRSASIDVVSERLRTQVRRISTAPVEIVTRGFPKVEVGKRAPAHSPWRILMGGWIGEDANQAKALLEGFHLLLGSYPDAELHLIDSRIATGGRPGVSVYDWMSPAEFEALCSKCNIGFAADPMTSWGRRFAATSFSTKVVTYIGRGMPFMYQGPADSTVGDLIAKYNCGVVVESERPEDIRDGFLRILSSYSNYQEECRRAGAEMFNIELIRGRFLQLLMKSTEAKTVL